MIGAYYQCYNRDICLEFVLQNYRKFYPNTSVVLVCDGGSDYSEQSKKYECNYFYENKIKTNKNLIFNDIDSVIIFFKRLSKYINLINEKFFILLEDDVYLMSKITIEDLLYDINGCNYGEILNQQTSNYINLFRTNKKSKFFLGGCGGSILKTEFFKKIFSNFDKIENDINFFCSYNPEQNWASDQILSFLCWVNNGEIGQYKGFCETWYPDYKIRMQNKKIEVLHQFKELY